MELLSPAIIKRFNRVGSQQDVADPLVICRFFNPTGLGTWFATEYNPQTKVFFGYVVLFGGVDNDWGSFSLLELSAHRGFGGLGVERDLFFDMKPFSLVEKTDTAFL